MKAVKIYKKIALIASIVSIISGIIGWFFFLDKIGVIDVQELLIEGGEGNSSDKVGEILQAAEKIHDYMKEHDYWYSDNATFSTTYDGDGGEERPTCCATYVSWVLQEVDLIEDDEHSDETGGVEEVLSKKSTEWKFIEVASFSEMRPGDIGCYHDGKPNEFTHINIYAGDNMFWDAGGDTNIDSPEPVSIGLPDRGVWRYIG